MESVSRGTLVRMKSSLGSGLDFEKGSRICILVDCLMNIRGSFFIESTNYGAGVGLNSHADTAAVAATCIPLLAVSSYLVGRSRLLEMENSGN